MGSSSLTEERRSRIWPAVLSLGLVLVVGILDHLTGVEISFSIFYLIPVALGTWFLGLRVGVFLSVLCAFVWWLDDAVLGSRAYSHLLTPLWNATMRCGVFVLTASMLARLKKALALERRSIAKLSTAYADLDRTRKEQLQLKDQLLSHVSHELRTPLTVIHQFITIPLDGLAGGPVNEEQRECLNTALRNVEQLRRLIGDLLDSVRAEGGSLIVEPRPMSLAEVVEDTVLSLVMIAKEKQVRLQHRCPAGLPPVVGDPGRVRQVLYNLVDNALRYTPPRGSVLVEVSPDAARPSFVGVTVSDTGSGMSEATMSRLFQRLFHEERRADSGRNGLGLGLYISREIVSLHGGEIWAESTPGQGSRFHFTLPFADTARTGLSGDAERMEGVPR